MEQKKPSLVLKVREINLIFFAFAPPPPPLPFFSLKFHIWGYPPLDQKQVVLKGGGSKLLYFVSARKLSHLLTQ